MGDMRPFGSNDGFALLISLIVLALFCLMSFYLAVNAATEIRISDNYEGEVHARFAAYAGLDHSRSMLRGLNLDDLLQGPDGSYDGSPSYMLQARALSFRNPVVWSVAQSLDILDPRLDVAGVPDDGLFNAGKYQSIPGTILIPMNGVSLRAPAAGDSEGPILARYFVKITDNNGESSELAGDPLDSPFVDGDGVIVIRSIGVASFIGDYVDGTPRRNSVVVFEARFRRSLVFDLLAPLVAQGTSIQPSSGLMFGGNSFLVQGGVPRPGIGILDADLSDSISPAAEMAAQLAPGQVTCIQGLGILPSIGDLTSAVASDPAKAKLLDKDYLTDFAQRRAKRFADSTFQGNQDWSLTPPDLGTYDPALPVNAPGQRPRITFVDGDLTVGGGGSGAGLLIVTGKLAVIGPFSFTGLVLVIGAGDFSASGTSWTLSGGIFVASIVSTGSQLNWGGVKLSLAGNGLITYGRDALRMAISLIPPDQVGFREITSSLDP